MKQRLAASNGKVKDFEAQLKDVEEVHSKIVANLKKDVAVADSRAQLIEKSRSELQEKSESLKQQVKDEFTEICTSTLVILKKQFPLFRYKRWTNATLS